MKKGMKEATLAQKQNCVQYPLKMAYWDTDTISWVTIVGYFEIGRALVKETIPSIKFIEAGEGFKKKLSFRLWVVESPLHLHIIFPWRFKKKKKQQLREVIFKL